MRTSTIRLMLAMGLFAASRSPAPAQGTALTLGVAPYQPPQTVTYRFTGSNPPGALATASPDAASVAFVPNTPMMITVTAVDAAHLRLTTGSGAQAQSITLMRSSADKIAAPPSSSPFTAFVQAYDRILSVTSTAAATPPGTTTSGAIPLLGGRSTVPGTLSVTQAKDSSVSVTVDGEGSTPTDGSPSNSGRGYPGGSGGGGFPGGRRGGYGRGSGSPGRGGASASVHIEARYVNGTLVHASETETFGSSGQADASGKSWTLDRTG